MSNKEKIVQLLEKENLTVKEISEKLNMNENQTRVYVNRLKKENKIIVAGIKNRYKVYKIKEERDPKAIKILQELLYDFTKLYYLMTLKMEVKDNIELNEEDTIFLDSIKQRIENINKFLQNINE